MSLRAASPWIALVLVTGCGDDSAIPDAGAPPDAGIVDAGADGSTADAGGGDGGTAAREPDWGCIGSVEAPVATVSEIRFDFRVLDVGTRVPVAGAFSRVCGSADLEGCSVPLGEVTTDADGRGNLTIAGVGPEGVFLYSDTTVAGYLGTLAVASLPFVADVDATAFVISPLVVEALARSAGAETDLDSTGAVTVVARDCEALPASGVEIDGPGRDRFYLRGATVATDATETDETGSATFLNATPGVATITATRASDATLLGTVEVPVRAGYVTQVFLDPTPDGARLSPMAP